MTLPYLSRLLCLVLASFFLVHLVTAFVIAVWTPFALRTAHRLSAPAAARLLLALRLFPAGLAAFGALGLCVPSYFWFEPDGIEEQAGAVCLFIAMLGLITCGVATLRAVRAAVGSLRFARECRRSGHERRLSSQFAPAVVIASSAPLLALTGLIRPRVVISERIVKSLSAEELSVVLSHERAHQTSRDNLKRLCMFLARGIMPAFRGAEALERAWIRHAEYAADEAAVGGDTRRSVALASALVRVARFATLPVSPVAISFLGDVHDLSPRVDRLLTGPPSPQSVNPMSRPSVASALILGACLTTLVFNPHTLRFVQSLLECLIR